MLRAADLLKKQIENVSVILSCAPSVNIRLIQSIVNAHSDNSDYDIVSGGASPIFQRSSLVIAASGTVTLEAAIFGIPMIVIYSVSGFSYRIGKALVRVSHICLANLIAGKTVAPELIQEDASPEMIAKTAAHMLNNPSELKRLQEEYKTIRHILGDRGASHRTADIAKNILQRNPM
jgi:lipid-A-disaccharide synthase